MFLSNLFSVPYTHTPIVKIITLRQHSISNKYMPLIRSLKIATLSNETIIQSTNIQINAPVISITTPTLIISAKISSSPISATTFLMHFEALLFSYLGPLSPSVIKHHVDLIASLFVFILDVEIPFQMEANTLELLIRKPGIINSLHKYMANSEKTSSVSWRNDGISYLKNEVFIDHVEVLDVIMQQGSSLII